MDNETFSKMLSRLQALCSRRECCSSDIYSKALRAFEGDEASANKAVQSLREDGFLDDLRYASAFSREKSALSGWGKTKIAYHLAAKGIERQTIETALGEVDKEASSKKLLAVMRAKLKTLENDPQRRMKLIRFAIGRGYSYDEAKETLEMLTSGQ